VPCLVSAIEALVDGVVVCKAFRLGMEIGWRVDGN